jgi:ribosomal-protein-alanine N-acetyltransferase
VNFLGLPQGDANPVLHGERVYLRPPIFGDHLAWATLREQSRGFLSPWEPTWASDDLTRAAYRRRVKRYQREAAEDLCYSFLIFRAGDHALLGGVTLSNVRRGVTQAASLGYWMGEPHAGRGFMREAVQGLVPHAFGPLRLHRIEAACMPANQRSIGLLERLGFQREGLARRYLMINGVWQDHLLYALLPEDRRF